MGPLIGLAGIALEVLLIVHVVRTGRDRIWIWLIIGIPVFGSLAYVVAELLPELLRGPAGRKARAHATKMLDPERAYREARLRLDTADTVDNRRAVAAQAVALGRPEEALQWLEPARQGLYANDPALLVGMAQAHFAAARPERTIAILEELRAAHPDFESADAHLLYTRALEAAGRQPEALAEYAALVRYFPGEEARYRQAEALAAAGDPGAARSVHEEICRTVERAPAYYRRAQRQWYDLAKRSLGP